MAQIVFLRELLALSGGSEVWLGLMLASWLVWTALGSAVLGRIGSGDPRRMVGALNLAVAVILPTTIVAARVFKPGIPGTLGEIPGPGGVFAASAVTMGPFCAVSGWLFSAASRLLGAKAGQGTGMASATVYLVEAFGSALGGILSSLILIRVMSPVAIALMVAWLNVLAAAWLLRGPRAVLVAAVTAGGAIWLGAGPLERVSLEMQWRPLTLVTAQHSVYGNLVLTSREDSRTLYENGVPLVTAPDEESAEKAVHYALLQHPSPRTLLLIGGGAGGGLGEAFRHPSLERAGYVELDPAIIRLAREHLGFHPPAQVKVHTVDGRRFLRTTPDRFDVIVVNLPEPQTAQLNRFYTVEFFQEAAARLSPGGVLALTLVSSENYISPARSDFLRCIHRSLRTVFREVVFLPGSSLRLFACREAGVLASGAGQLLDRLARRNIQTRYVSQAYMAFDYTEERARAVESILREDGAAPLNRDFAPAGYFLNTVLWGARVSPTAGAWLRRAANIEFPWAFGLAAGGAWLAASALCVGSRPAAVAAYSALSMGAVVMGLEVLLLLGFQSAYGYVYSQLAILAGMLMAGMALGSWLALRSEWGLLRLAGAQAAGALTPLALCMAFSLARGAGWASPLFAIFAAGCGLLGGYQFAIASRIYYAGSATERRGSPGGLYALDLLGACAGAVLCGVFFVPLYGFWKTALIMAAVCLAPALPAAIRARRAPER